MKYIYTVIGLILIVLGIAGITFLKTDPPASKELARINKRILTVDEFNKRLEERRAAPPYSDKRRYLDDFLTEEILIQEAKRRELDLKEPFRRSIRNYYEQTLLKSLMHEKMSEIRVSVSEDEIAERYKNEGKIYEARIAIMPTEAEAVEAIRNFPVAKFRTQKLRMEDIPPAIADAVVSLKIGEVSKKPVPCDSGFFVFKLEGFATVPLPPLATVHDEIRRTLEERKKRLEMEKWLDNLKKRARITINEAALK